MYCTTFIVIMTLHRVKSVVPNNIRGWVCCNNIHRLGLVDHILLYCFRLLESVIDFGGVRYHVSLCEYRH